MIINVAQKAYYTGTKSLDGNTYRLTFRWNTYAEKWYIDIVGLSNTVDIKSIALLGGKDLLATHGYLELGQLWVVDNAGINGDPNFDEMGERYTLEYTPRA